jgi:flagellar biosynthesis/type III secretory pathway protein FliH
MKLWEKLTSARYNAGYQRGFANGHRAGSISGRREELSYIIAYLETRLTEFAEPFNDENLTLGFRSAIQELKELR